MMMATTSAAKRSPLVTAYVAFAWATGAAIEVSGGQSL